MEQAEPTKHSVTTGTTDSTKKTSDPTIAHAGLTELEDVTVNATTTSNTESMQIQAIQGGIDGGAANKVAQEQWDNTKTQVSVDSLTDSRAPLPRDPAETQKMPVSALDSAAHNWADDVPSEAAVVPTEDPATVLQNGRDEFREVRGRGGRGRGGRHSEPRGRGRGGLRGERRGRGGGYRGDRGGVESGARREWSEGGHRGGIGRGHMTRGTAE